MRRFLIALTGTIAGLAALFSFRSTGSTAGATAMGSSSSSSSSSAAAAGKTAVAGGKTVTGAAESSPYGTTQVAVVLKGKKIVAVNVVSHTDDGSMSQMIDGNAIPQLTKEALAAQSAKIDAVTGASYTSAGYIKSLQSALDKA